MDALQASFASHIAERPPTSQTMWWVPPPYWWRWQHGG